MLTLYNTDEEYSELVAKYKKSQAAMKVGGPSSKALIPKPKNVSTPFFAVSYNYFLTLYYYLPTSLQLNFARFRQNLKGFHKTTTNIQVVGFTEQDSHRDVLRKGAEGLGLKCNLDFLSLICSGGEVPDSPINGVPWTLGEYIKLHGGNQNRSKKVWGINIPIEVEEDGMKSHDSVSYHNVHINSDYIIHNCVAQKCGKVLHSGELCAKFISCIMLDLHACHYIIILL